MTAYEVIMIILYVGLYHIGLITLIIVLIKNYSKKK